MPSKLKSGGTFPYVLKCDRDDSSDSVFNLRILSCLENEQIVDVRDRYFVVEEADRRELVDEMLMIAVESYSVPSAGGMKLKEFLTAAECFELIAAAISGTMLTPDERKKQELLHTSATANFATDAVAESVATS